MATTITAGNATNGAAIASDNTGILELKTGTGSGTTAMTVDASQNVGIGTSTLNDKLNLYSSTSVYQRFQNSTTGTGATDGFQIGTDANARAFIWNYEAQFISFATSNTERARITSDGLFQFNSGYGSVATVYGCRAWVNFNGTGTVAIRASGNVSSITDNGTGDYTVNFTNAMPNANYSYVGCGSIRDATSNNVMITVGGDRDVAPTTSALRINTIYNNSGANTSIDSGEVCVSVFR